METKSLTRGHMIIEFRNRLDALEARVKELEEENRQLRNERKPLGPAISQHPFIPDIAFK